MQRRNNKRPCFTYILKIVLNQVVIEKSAVIVSTGVVLSKRIIANTKKILSSLLSNMICSDGCILIHWSIPKFATKSLFLTSKQVNAWGIYWRKVSEELVKGKGLVPLWFRFGPALVPVWSWLGALHIEAMEDQTAFFRTENCIMVTVCRYEWYIYEYGVLYCAIASHKD